MAADHSRKRIDLTGMQFGYLTVLEKAPNIGKNTAWLCQCKCGNIVIVKTKHLREGRTVSCGCRKKEGLHGLHYIDGTCIEMISTDHVRKNSKSRVTGVYFDPANNKWRAEIMFKGERYYLGRFSSFNEAVKARQRAKEELHDAAVDDFKESR